MLAVGSLEPAATSRSGSTRPTATTRGHQGGLGAADVPAGPRIPTLRIPHRPVGIVGIYDVADDWIPVYDRTDLDGFYVALGTSGNQFKNAAIAGHAWPSSSSPSRPATTTTPTRSG